VHFIAWTMSIWKSFHDINSRWNQIKKYSRSPKTTSSSGSDLTFETTSNGKDLNTKVVELFEIYNLGSKYTSFGVSMRKISSEKEEVQNLKTMLKSDFMKKSSILSSINGFIQEPTNFYPSMKIDIWLHFIIWVVTFS